MSMSEEGSRASQSLRRRQPEHTLVTLRTRGEVRRSSRRIERIRGEDGLGRLEQWLDSHCSFLGVQPAVRATDEPVRYLGWAMTAIK